MQKLTASPCVEPKLKKNPYHQVVAIDVRLPGSLLD